MRIQRGWSHPFVTLLGFAFVSLLVGLPAEAGRYSLQSSDKKPARITGRVVRSDTGRPLPKVVVTIFSALQQRESFSVRTDATGAFRFEDVRPGTYRLRAQRNGFVQKLFGQTGGGPSGTIVVSAAQSVENLDLQLDPGGVITGKVTDQDDDPIENVEVVALRLRFRPGGEQWTSIVRTSRTDDIGNYRLPGLSPGLYYVQAGGQGEAVTVSSQTANFGYSPTFFPGSMNRGGANRVSVSGGQESRDIDISLRSSPTFTVNGAILDGKSENSVRRYSVGFARGGATATRPIEADGSFAIRGLTQGAHTIVAIASEDGKLPRRAYKHVIISDSDVHLVLDFASSSRIEGHLQTNEKGYSFEGLRVNLVPPTEEAVFASGMVNEKGEFVVTSLPPGEYSFVLDGRGDEVYVSKVTCRGQKQDSRYVRIELGESIDDCELFIGTDVAEASGQVISENKNAGWVTVVFIPAEPKARENPRGTRTGQADGEGKFQVKGLIPGRYLVFAIEPSDDAIYYDLGFADRNRRYGKIVEIFGREKSILRVALSKSQ